jgi:tRNA synthetases class I (I, L, M and V)
MSRLVLLLSRHRTRLRCVGCSKVDAFLLNRVFSYSRDNNGDGADDVKNGNNNTFAAVASYLQDGAPLPTANKDPPAKTEEIGADPNNGKGSENNGDQTLSKSALKKLAKGKGKKKEKPTWNTESTTKKEKKKVAPTNKPAFVNTTPKGQKKDLSMLNMDDGYHPSAVEAAWQDWWEASGYYTCDPAAAASKSSEEKFVMVIPPPNVTGSLHLGHALTAAVEDTLTRWHRMMGHATLYVPGT